MKLSRSIRRLICIQAMIVYRFNKHTRTRPHISERRSERSAVVQVQKGLDIALKFLNADDATNLSALKRVTCVSYVTCMCRGNVND